jgi:hypothetical protein
MGALAIREIKASTVLRVYTAVHKEPPSTARNVKALVSQICSYAESVWDDPVHSIGREKADVLAIRIVVDREVRVNRQCGGDVDVMPRLVRGHHSSCLTGHATEDMCNGYSPPYSSEDCCAGAPRGRRRVPDTDRSCLRLQGSVEFGGQIARGQGQGGKESVRRYYCTWRM